MKSKVLLFLALFSLVLTVNAQSYKKYELDKLKAFFSLPSAIEGKNNAEALGITDLEDPSSWKGIKWQSTTFYEKRVVSVDWGADEETPIIAGRLDLSDFKALEELECSNNKLTGLTVEADKKLIYITCKANKLEVLNLTSATALVFLSCSYNELTQLDVSQNINLKSLFCYKNKLEYLDLTHNKILEKIFCANNKLTSLDVSQNETLENISCWSNELLSLKLPSTDKLEILNCGLNTVLSTLDVSKNKNLIELKCEGNGIVDLDVSNNPNLEKLYCNNNFIKKLDVSSNLELKELYCYANKISELNLGDRTTIKKVRCDQNRLRLSKLPNPAEIIITSYFYANQLFEIGEKIDDSFVIEKNTRLDLSAEKSVAGMESTIIWKDKDGNVIQPSSNDNWVFTFDNNFLGKEIYCELENIFLPNLIRMKSVNFTIVQKAIPLIVSDQELTVKENTENGFIIGKVQADYTGNEALNYTILSGNEIEIFALNENTGELTVNNTTKLDFETIQNFSLSIKVSDGTKEAVAKMDIALEDVNEHPLFEEQTFSIDENSLQGTEVAVLEAVDPEGVLITFTLEGGNTNNAFFLDTGTGKIMVDNSAVLDFETTPNFELQVSASDGENKTQRTITINLNNIVETTSLYKLSSEGIRLYPIPSNTYLNVEFTNGQTTFDNYSILDNWGRVISKGNLQTKTEINVNELSQGIYFIQLQGDKRIETTRFVVD